MVSEQGPCDQRSAAAAQGAREAASAARLREAAQAFAIPGRWLSSAPHGSGHIHDTFVALFDAGGRRVRYVQQRINTNVFRDPQLVMDNVTRVTAHQRSVLEREGAADVPRRALEVVPTRAGTALFFDADGAPWRCYRFIEGAESRDVIGSAGQARGVAEAFGRFQAQLADLPGPRLHETIPRFHDARLRFDALLAAAREDVHGRLRECRRELDFVLAREAIVDRLDALKASGALPERVTHNDTKVNNVLLDTRSGEALCVIDLDTVMPGLALYDFGDLARSAVSPTAEDERDLSRMRVSREVFAALAEGYLRGAGAFLSAAERGELVFAARLLTLVIGTRFLTDHLEGDRYFRIQRAGHNLDRARTQLRLVACLEEQEAALEECAARAFERTRG